MEIGGNKTLQHLPEPCSKHYAEALSSVNLHNFLFVYLNLLTFVPPAFKCSRDNPQSCSVSQLSPTHLG